MPTINLDRYSQDMRALAAVLTNVKDGGGRVHRKGSKKIVEVLVVAGAVSITMLIQESGLYTKGFLNGNGRWYFKGEELGASELKFGCSYVGSHSIGIFADAQDPLVARKRNLTNIVESVRALSAFAGGNDLDLKVPLATMVFLISEAIRFTIVYDRMVETCKNAGGTFTFSELQPYVQNWEGLSSGSAVSGTCPGKIFTAHS